MTNEMAIRILSGDVLGTNEQQREAVCMAIEALSWHWIPVSERLPETFERVIVWMSWGGFSMMDFQLGHFYTLNSVHPVPDEAVTAWQPLPKPYERSEE